MKTTDVDRGQALRRMNYYKNRVGYRQIHYRIEYLLGKPKICDNPECTNTDSKRFEWANISGEYSHNIDEIDLWDWQRLCVRCHRAYDANKRKDNDLVRLPYWMDKYISLFTNLEGKRG